MRTRRLVRVAAVVAASVILGPLLVAALAISILNETNGSIVSSGEERTYLLYVPPGYDRARPTPLVISLHGAAVWPAQQRNMTHWNRLADRDGFIVVYPSGTGVGPRVWRVNRGPGLPKDVRFVSDLIDSLEASYNIDRERIFVNGFSLGGGLSFVLSCALSDRIAAVGTVAAAQTLPASWCASDRSMPMIAFHGTADPVPYNGGRSPDPFNPLTFPAVRTWTASWAQRNRCASSPTESSIAADVTRLEYRGCAHGADVVLYTLEGVGHQWPGGKALPTWLFGRTTGAIDATELMWTFFRDHPKPPPDVRAQRTRRSTSPLHSLDWGIS